MRLKGLRAEGTFPWTAEEVWQPRLSFLQVERQLWWLSFCSVKLLLCMVGSGVLSPKEIEIDTQWHSPDIHFQCCCVMKIHCEKEATCCEKEVFAFT